MGSTPQSCCFSTGGVWVPSFHNLPQVVATPRGGLGPQPRMQHRLGACRALFALLATHVREDRLGRWALIQHVDQLLVPGRRKLHVRVDLRRQGLMYLPPPPRVGGTHQPALSPCAACACRASAAEQWRRWQPRNK